MRVLTGRPEVVKTSFYALPLDVDSPSTDIGSVTATLKDLDGEVVFSGPATYADTQYSVTLPSNLSLGLYTLTWTNTTYENRQEIEVVGGFIFDTIEGMRALPQSSQTAQRLFEQESREIRDTIEEEFEQICNRSFTTRVRRVTKTAVNGELWLDDCDIQTIISVNGEPFTGELSDIGQLTGVSGRCVIEYRYGLQFVPADVKRAGIAYFKYLAARKTAAVPDGATSVSYDGGGGYTLSVAGQRGAETGLPSVDAILNRYKYNVIGVA
jgi:hypothetical protein